MLPGEIGQNAFELVKDLLFWAVLAIFIWRITQDLWKKSVYGIIGTTLICSLVLFIIYDPQKVPEALNSIWGFIIGRG